MTNAMIILSESMRLMREGKIKGSGQFVEIEEADGTKKTIELPEAIHTFAGWKALGFSVKKGEKSSIKFPIWKRTAKQVENENGEAEEETNMFMKTAAWFTAAQVEPIKG